MMQSVRMWNAPPNAASVSVGFSPWGAWGRSGVEWAGLCDQGLFLAPYKQNKKE